MLHRKKHTPSNPVHTDTNPILSDEDFLTEGSPEESSFTEESFEEPAPKRKKLPAWAILPVIAVILVIAFGASALSSKDGKSGNSTLQVVEVTTGNIREVYNSSGTIESENTKTYYSPVTAPIQNLNAEVGKEVKNGDLLVTFDTTNLERDNQQAQLTLQSNLNTSQATRQKNAEAIDAANAASAELAAQANALADEYNRIVAQTDAVKAELDADYAQRQSQFSSAATQKRIQELNQEIPSLNNQIAEYENLQQKLSVIYTGSGPAYDAAKAKQEAGQPLDATESELIKNVELYQKVVDELPGMRERLSANTTELNNLQALTAYDDSAYQALCAQRDAAYAAWKAAYDSATQTPASSGMASAELANLDISDNLAELAALTPEELLQKGREGMKADMDGVIASIGVLESNSAMQGAAVFSIASTENVRVKLEISPDDYEKMKIGNQVSVTIGDHKYEGTLSSLDKIAVTNAKGNPVIGARVHINNPDADICIGATAKVSMTVAESNDVLVVPTEAINASTDGDFVFVIEKGVVRKKVVELGTASTSQVEIKSGLKKGDQVVNDMNVDISEGMKATAAPISEEDSADSKE